MCSRRVGMQLVEFPLLHKEGNAILFIGNLKQSQLLNPIA